MFMVLGLVAFLFLTGSAVLGAVMLLATAVLSASRTWRTPGLIGLCSGLAGAALGAAALGAILWLMEGRAPAETWLLFAAAGFGWMAFGAIGIYALLILLKQPNRWADRRRNASASL